MACLGRIGGFAGLLGLLLAGYASAQAPAAPNPAARPAPAPDPAFEAARLAFEALPEAERKALQDALVWTGDYNSTVVGTFGRRTYDALLAWAKRSGATGTEIPDAKGRRAILAAGEAARNAARFIVKPDPVSGIVLGVPERLLPKRTTQAGGTRWQSADGRITLDTKSFAPGETDLDAIFARITAPLSERKVTYKLKRPDFLVVTAETPTGKSYIRYAAGSEGIRGFTFGYDKALAADTDRIVIAVANSFMPFPGAEPVAAPTAKAPPPVLPPVATRASPSATGLAVGSGRILTAAAALETCPNPRIGGGAARIAVRDPARNLALLEAASAAKGAAPPMRTGPTAPGDPLVALGAEASGTVTVAPASAGEGARVFAPLQPGAGGAPVLDRSGALVGLVARFPAAARLIAGVAPPTSYALVPAEAVTAFLAENGVSPAPSPAAKAAPGSLGAVAATLSGAVVAIECPR
ncbi:trypsin-like peptidase domain-containing protein [Methylobacterium iners]|uniref:Peptidoglycan-binding protein n=1 Tax=Methylobacterium iners TaxID=418707 RepID=A0ABQ4RTW2_9HYPH|nr:trypsin-like peptidase domain-containing protein [Methylobacterium iners]GJD94164.1 hypothetical protein OCOJLMKI_1366 [Methylobacterium iners]